MWGSLGSPLGCCLGMTCWPVRRSWGRSCSPDPVGPVALNLGLDCSTRRDEVEGGGLADWLGWSASSHKGLGAAEAGQPRDRPASPRAWVWFYGGLGGPTLVGGKGRSSPAL